MRGACACALTISLVQLGDRMDVVDGGVDDMRHATIDEEHAVGRLALVKDKLMLDHRQEHELGY